MNLEQIAELAMDYLDVFGVAAEWEVPNDDRYGLIVITDFYSLKFFKNTTIDAVMTAVIVHTIKSPN